MRFGLYWGIAMYKQFNLCCCEIKPTSGNWSIVYCITCCMHYYILCVYRFPLCVFQLKLVAIGRQCAHTELQQHVHIMWERPEMLIETLITVTVCIPLLWKHLVCACFTQRDSGLINQWCGIPLMLIIYPDTSRICVNILKYRYFLEKTSLYCV